MSDTPLQLPAHTIQPVTGDFSDADSPLFLVAANTADSELQTQVIDIRDEVPDAFPPREAPIRIVTDIQSFLAELTRRPLDESTATLWGNRKAGQITAVYNDLRPDWTADYTRRNDQLTLQFVRDPDWTTFLKAADGKFHGQEEFGDLIEEAGHLIVSHPAAELMEIVDSIRASSKGSFESRIRRETGSQHLTFSEEVSSRAGTSQKPLEVPREVTFKARPFEDYPEVEVTCWLRLRINQGSLLLGLFPKPYEHLVRDAWSHVVGTISDDVGKPVYAYNVN